MGFKLGGLLSAAMLLVVHSSEAQTVNWALANLTPANASVGATASAVQGAYSSATPATGTIRRGAGLTLPGTPGSSRLNSDGWTVGGDLATAQTNNDYLEIQVNLSGYQDVSVTYGDGRSGTGPNTSSFWYSAAGGSFVQFNTGVSLTSGSPRTLDLSAIAAIENQNDVRFRVYGWGATGGTGTYGFTSFSLTATPVPPPDTTAPVAALQGALTNVTTAGGTAYDFTVRYTDAVNVDTTTIAADNITYVGPAGASIAVQSKTPASGNATQIDVVYRLTPPGGSWDSSDNGNFALSTTSTTANAVKDTNNNAVAGTSLGNFDVNIAAGDTTPPQVSSIVRQSAENPTNDATVTFRVTFDEAINVSTVQDADFTVTASGPTGASVASVNNVNATTFDVTVNTGTGDGTIRLDVLAAATIEDTAGNDLNVAFTTGQEFTIDKTAPAVSVPDLDAGSDSGSSNTDNITNVTTPTFIGTAEAGVTVEILEGTTVVGSGVATGGNYSITTSALTPGTKSISARAADAVGNVATTGGLSVTIDTTAPDTSATEPFDTTLVGTSASLDFASDDAAATVALLVRAPGAGSFTNSGLTPAGNAFTVPFATNGEYRYYTIGTDVAGNVEAAPGTEDVLLVVNTVPNGPFTVTFPVGAEISRVFPMTPTIDVVLGFPVGITTGGTITVQRFETNAAPAGVNAARLIDQWIRITNGGVVFNAPADVFLGIDAALLGGLTGPEINTVFRDNGGVVTTLPFDYTSDGDSSFETPGFSDFYFGNNDASVIDWSVIEE